MERTMQSMREACKNTPIEIINYNYARVVIDIDEARHFSESGNDIIQKFILEINGSAEGLKTQFGTVLTAKMSGKDKNIVLIEGAGRLFDASPDAFADIARLKSRIVASIEGINSAPAITTADMLSSAAPANPPAPVKKSPEKPAVQNVQGSAPAKAPNPIKKEKPVKKPAESPVAQDEKMAFALEVVKAEQILSKDDMIKRVQVKFSVDQAEAAKIVDAFVSSTKGIDCTDGFVFINKG